MMSTICLTSARIKHHHSFNTIPIKVMMESFENVSNLCQVAEIELIYKLEVQAGKWKERVARKAGNPKALEKSRIIAINILAQLRKLGMTQKDLAEKLQETPQTINSWVKGNSNFMIETIVRIEEVLGVELIGVRVG
ncbi:helix-turn-helix domain-containing protein [Dyadobacter luticola]|uniref:Helix-turn-helix transcriptional regulator n=1 Tax=Dyadobacter luticola TaxID=1979387 RepID=A0A5R9L2R7_9BACT|nr:helix-turn-helix transcriptional regulator [Dyadobacter luticola]TLV02874.1 helix-turn-helix transcriptional regulator [Dyadobacter luticola]